MWHIQILLWVEYGSRKRIECGVEFSAGYELHWRLAGDANSGSNGRRALEIRKMIAHHRTMALRLYVKFCMKHCQKIAVRNQLRDVFWQELATTLLPV
jgi:hypothetical protein